MNYLQQYKSFINSQHFSEGLRMTFGVVLPALLLGYFGMISIGIVLSLGALLVSVNDSPGPVHHRRNGMLFCLFFITIVTFITAIITPVPILLTIFLVLGCFFFSMITVFGARAGGIGTASMIIIALTMDPRHNISNFSDAVRHTFYIATGGLWYICYSMLLQRFRPYRLPQQALGDCIEATADYLEIRASLYKKEVDYKTTFDKILHQQAVVQQKQNDLSELLFKTRSILKESTVVGRTLVMMFLDLSDIFEKIMMSHQQYSLLHNYFDETGILSDYNSLALLTANQLREVGLAVKSGEPSVASPVFLEEIEKTRQKLDDLRHNFLKAENIEGFISLRKILENIADIAERINTLHKYSTYDEKLAKKQLNKDWKKYTSSQEISFKVLKNNFSFRSDNFRHAIRVSVAIFVGFLVSQIFNIGHSYWVLLTIIVILKPAYSLTKKRNGERLGGTFAGIAIGIAILFLTTNNTALLTLLFLFMLGSFVSMRKNYFVSVLLMTPYLVIFYHLLSPDDFYNLLKDRLIDTVIGSVIAFAASYFLFPTWEKDKIKPVMVNMLKETRSYFSVIANGIKGGIINPAEIQVARKNALVALANLSDTFNRMVAEPESRQKGINLIHQFVVLNHMLTSYIAALAYYSKKEASYPTDELLKATEEIYLYFSNAIANLNAEKGQPANLPKSDSINKLNDISNQLLDKRKKELEHGFVDTDTRKSLVEIKSLVDQVNLVYNAAVDIDKMSKAYMEEA